MKTTLLILSVYAVFSSLLIVVLFFQVQGLKKRIGTSPVTATDFTRVFDINISNAPKKGPENARITIVEVSDYECKVCSEASGVVDRLMLEYPGKIQRVFKHLPLNYHPQAASAASAAMAAHVQGRFWEMHALLMNRNRDLNHDLYLTLAQDLELNLEQFKKDMALDNWQDYLQEDVSEAMALGVPGTPTYFINGVKVVGIDYQKLYEAIIKVDPSFNR